MDRKRISELVEERNQHRQPLAHIVQDETGNLSINGHHYDIVANENDAFDLTAFQKKYVPALSHYDYILGDVGYGKLRLRGFYSDERYVAKPLTSVASIDIYLSEFCNFGAPYFILHNLEAKISGYASRPRRHRRNHDHDDHVKFKKHKHFKIITKKS